MPHLSALESGSAASRRETFRRSELLLPHGHGLDASALADNLGLHDMAHQMEEVQVRRTRTPLLHIPSPSVRTNPHFPPFRMRVRGAGVGFSLSALPGAKLSPPFSFQNVEDQHLLMHDQTVIRKGQ